MELPIMTQKQAAILGYLREFHAEEDRLPSTREIQAHFGFSSQTGAMGHLNALAKKGMIENRRGCAKERSWWRFTRKEETL